MSLGKNLASMRKARKLSQEYIAEQLGVSRQAVSKWETGQTEPTTRNLVELARLFDVTVSDLVEPDQIVKSDKKGQKRDWRRIFDYLSLSFFTGSAIMHTIVTSDRYYYLYTSVLIGLCSVAMVVSVSLLPPSIRKRMAYWNLLYAAVICFCVLFLAPRIGNVYTAVIMLTVCVLYAKYIRFRPETQQE